MGGTFDPIHNGHIETAKYIIENKKFDEFVFIPCYISPLKQDLHSSSTNDRLNMLKLALKDYPYFTFSDIELRKKEISYTINTLREFKKDDNELNLIIGFDNYALFEKWYLPEEILKISNVLVLKRNINSAELKINHSFNGFEFVTNPIINISSTIIREMVSNNLSIDGLVPDEVKNYINLNKLYKTDYQK